MACHCRLVDQAQRALLDHSSGREPIPNELYNEETHFVGELREAEGLDVLLVRRSILESVYCALCRSNQSVKVDSCVKRLKSLFVVGLCIELKDLQIERLYVLEL